MLDKSNNEINGELDMPNKQAYMTTRIELWYCELVEALAGAARLCIPRIPQHSLKNWWISDLSRLKRNALLSHNTWVMLGRPKNCPLFTENNREAMLYKSAIKKAKEAMKNSISNELQYTLVNKKPTKFLKTWKN